MEKSNKVDLVKKVLVIVGNVVFYAVILALFLFSLMNINAGNGKKNFPNLFGKGMLSVESGSMEHKENGYVVAEWNTYKIKDIKKGDLIYANVFKGKISKIKIGDVITFYDGSIDALNTHRIVYIDVEHGYVITQGDYVITQSTTDTFFYPSMTDAAKDDNRDTWQLVETKDIKGVVTGVKRGAGKTLDNVRSNWLFYFVIPVAVILVAEIFFVFKNFMDLKKEKNSEALGDEKEKMLAELEAEKEKMRQELLAELRKEQMKESTTVKEPVKEAEDEESSNDDNSPEEE